MKRTTLIVFSLLALFVLISCTPKPQPIEQKTREQLMAEAEAYFATSLTQTNFFDIYPQSATVSAGQTADTWPAFKNTKNTPVQVQLQVDCQSFKSIDY